MYCNSRCLSVIFFFVSFVSAFLPQTLHSDDNAFNPPATILLPQREKKENLKYLLELAPYYKSSKTEEDTYAMGLFLSADINDAMEIQFASDTFSYQKPDKGFSDIMLGFRWDFLDSYVHLATLAYLELPTGIEEFAEPYAEPTLTIEASRAFGDFTAVLTLGSTYLADGEDEDFYFNFSYQAELDYSPDEKNEFSAQFSGYAPDQLDDGIMRMLAGLGYTRNIDNKNAIGLSAYKGLAKRGTDLTLIFSYDYQW